MKKVLLLLLFAACSAISALAQTHILSAAEPPTVNAVYDSNGVNSVDQLPYTQPNQLPNVPTDETTPVTNTANSSASTTRYINNLRISRYRIFDQGSCSFDDLSGPDPRFRISVPSYNYFTIVKDNNISCNEQQLDGGGRYIAGRSAISTSAANPTSILFNIESWDDNGCGDDDTYDTGLTCVFNDKYRATTSQSLVLDVNTMNNGYNERTFYWSTSGAQYTITVSWEASEQLTAVTVFSGANQSGTAQDFAVGQYNVSLLTGVGNDAISSMNIASGYKVTLYNQAYFNGYPLVLRGLVTTMPGGYNDIISSLKVEVDDNLPPARGKTLLIYFGGTGKDVKFQLERNASKIKADDMIFIKGCDGNNGPVVGPHYYNSYGTYLGYNENNFAYEEGDLLYYYEKYVSSDVFYSHVSVLKNTNTNAPPNSYVFGVDLNYEGSGTLGYSFADSYVAASNVLRVLRKYNMRGYDTILIAGHSRGSAVGISSLLYGIKKAVTGDTNVDGISTSQISSSFPGFADEVNAVFGTAKVINVLALDPVAGSNLPGFRNGYHMGDNWRINEIYAWLKGQYPNININFSEIYANGAKMVENTDIGGWAGIVVNVTGLPLYTVTFEPSPNYLFNDASNNVQRYWLGYRHSSMENKIERLSDCYNAVGATLPWLHTVEMMNAALNNQTLFRDNTYWFNKFHKSDTDGWLGALKLDGCTASTLVNNTPDYDLEIGYYHGKRHTTFDNINGTSVDMRTFVPDNNLELTPSSANYFTPTQAGLYTAYQKVTDAEGWTNYFTCKGELLLGIQVAFGNTPEPSEVTLNLRSNLSAGRVVGMAGFVTNPNGTHVMNRTWNVASTITGPASVRDYFSRDYFYALNNSITNAGQTPLTDTTKMWFYKATSGAAHSPIQDIPTADIYTNGATASLTTWKLGGKERAIYAEYMVNSLTRGGGGGASSGGDGPLCATPLAYTLTRSSNSCTGGSTTIGVSNSQTGTNYQLFLNGSTAVGTAVAGTGAAISFGNQAALGIYTVVATTAVGGCKAPMTGTVVVAPVTPTLYVNTTATGTGDGSTWANAITDLNNALDLAHLCSNVTTIKVAAGTYKPTKKPYDNSGQEIVTTDNRDKTFHIRGGITLEGGYDAATGNRNIKTSVTTLSGDIDNDNILDDGNCYHVVLIASVSVTLDGFFVTGGNANDANGSISLDGGITPIYRRRGGGINSSKSVTLTNNTVYSNAASAGSGGGINCESGTNILNDNTIRDNNANFGGGIRIFNGTNTLTNNTVYSNRTTYDGGGIYCELGTNIFNGNTIRNNTSASSGGGIIILNGITNTLTNNTVYSNLASDDGGGINISSGINILTNNTFSQNTAFNNGGGIYTNIGTNTLTNNIFWGNRKYVSDMIRGADFYSEGANNSNTFKNNLLQLAVANYPVSNTGNYAIGTAATGNLFAQDPSFIAEANPAGADNISRTADDGLGLQASSPCMNTGTATGAPATDILGVARPFGSGVDMGAYEYTSVPLAVELLDFKGVPTVSGNLLTWTTVSEVNNKGFEVERLNALSSWDNIGFKTANNKASTYQFTDNAPFATSYYRLRQIDFDGTQTLSKVISVEQKGKGKGLKVYPNPVSSLLTIENTEGADFQVLNLLGQQVLTGKTVSVDKGLDVSALPKGTYILKVGAEQAKFVKQ